MKKTLLFFGDYWDDMWRRRQQLAWRLSQTNLIEHVVYIERPLPVTSFLKFLVGRADRDAADRWRRVLHNRSWVMPVKDKFSVLTTFAPLPPVGSKILFRTSELVRDQWLLGQLRKHCDGKRPLVWISHPQISTEVIQALELGLLWYDCTEDFAAWPDLPDCVRAQIKATDRWLTEHADVVTAVSHTLYKEKRNINPNTHWLPNAVDTDLFLQPREMYPIPLELRNRTRPILAFVGGLSEWAHDWELLDKVAASRPEWTILFIGPTSVSVKTQRMLAGHSNILCVGQKSYQELPAYLAHSDVCFQFYRVERGNDTRNSQKLFLYFAAGKPVVATPSADVEEYRSLVNIAETAQAFVACVEQVAVDRSPEVVRSRHEMARENSWQTRIGQIRQILDETNAQQSSDRRRRVVMFIPRRVHTGGERYLVEIFDHLQCQGVPVEPIYLEHTAQERTRIVLVIDCLLANLHFYCQARQLGNLANVVFFEDFHLHPRLWLFNLLVHLTSGRLKTVVLVQSDLFYHTALSHRWARWLDERVVRIFLQQSSLILTNSEFTYQRVLSLGMNPRKATAVYCGYDGDLRIRSAEAPVSGKDQQRILFAGQCAECKGIEFLLRAMPMIPGQMALDIVGDTAAEPGYFIKLQHLVAALGLENQVTFHGHISDKAILAQFYQRANVFVLPSLTEGFGIVLLDAMSFALPIVATQVGAIPELLQDGVNGLLVPPADQVALAEAIQRVLDSPALQEQYGRAGYKFIAERREFYSWEAVGKRALQAMQPLLQEVNQ